MINCWFGLVIWIPGLVIWIPGLVIWIPGLVIWIPGLVIWIPAIPENEKDWQPWGPYPDSNPKPLNAPNQQAKPSVDGFLEVSSDQNPGYLLYSRDYIYYSVI